MSNTIEETTARELAELAKVKKQLMREIALEDGMSGTMASAFVAWRADRFEITSKGTVENAKGEVLQAYLKRKRGELSEFYGLPAETEGGGPKVDPKLLTSAFIDHNRTARSKLIAEVGSVRGTELARRFGLKDMLDFSTPGKRPEAKREYFESTHQQPTVRPPSNDPDFQYYTKRNFNLTQMSRIARDAPERHARLMAAAQLKPGSTKPVL